MTRRQSLLLSLLPPLAALLIAAAGAQAASTPSLAGLETGVGRSTPLTPALVRPDSPRPGITPPVAAHGYDRIAPATGVAAEAEGVALRSFTRGNFRENLARRTGGIPEDAEAHHVFPQKFAQQFEQRGINVNDPNYGAWWERTVHRQASYQYNREWQQFLRGNPNRGQVLDFGRSQAQRYGLEPGF